MSKQAYEYRNIFIELKGGGGAKTDFKAMDDEFNRLGREGFKLECVKTIHDIECTSGFLYTFSREM